MKAALEIAEKLETLLGDYVPNDHKAHEVAYLSSQLIGMIKAFNEVLLPEQET